MGDVEAQEAGWCACGCCSSCAGVRDGVGEACALATLALSAYLAGSNFLAGNSASGYASLGVVGAAAVLEWRVRYLGDAKSISESADRLQEENARLSATVDGLNEVVRGLEGERDRFAAENDRFAQSNGRLEGMVGLLGDGVGDIDEARRGLEALYDKYQKQYEQFRAQNLVFRNSNAVRLFLDSDADKSGFLSQGEIARMAETMEGLYDLKIDVGAFDADADDHITLREFTRRLKELPL